MVARPPYPIQAAQRISVVYLVFPACAGIEDCADGLVRFQGCLPRMRGD
jgi:hypothetical protein